MVVIFRSTTTLGGWDQTEAIGLLGTYQIASGLLGTFIEPNVAWFRAQVIDGLLDDVLLKPVSSIFLVSLGTCAPLGLIHVVTGFVVLIAAILHFEELPDVIACLAWLQLFAAGMVIVWATRVFLASLTFWAPSFQPEVLFKAFWEFGRYPVSIYRQPIRFALTYVSPVAIIATIPAGALSRGPNPLETILWSALAVLAVIGVQLIWQRGLRRYTSATS